MLWQSILLDLITIIILLLAARVMNQLVIKTKITEALISKENFALGIQISGYLFGVLLIIGSVLAGKGTMDIWTHLMWICIYGVGSIIFLDLFSVLGLKIIISGKCLEAIKSGNSAAGIVSAGGYIATALIIAGSVAGDSQGSWVSAVVFFVAGQAAFLIITWIFRMLTSYDDNKEILEGNVAAALSYAGLMIAVGLIVGHAVEGDFVNYYSSFIAFGKALLVVVALYPVRQWIVQGILLGSGFTIYGGRLDKEIKEDRNISAGIIEASVYVATALLVIRIM
jgi:uncharacterized membrane protein YjfL (UPF0719 family)